MRRSRRSAAVDPTTANLLDQRDKYIDELSKLMDIRVVPGQFNQVTVYTGSGTELVGTQAVTLSFTPQGTVGPTVQWNPDPTKSGARDHHGDDAGRRIDRPDHLGRHPVRRDRRVSADARQDPAGGAGAARRDRRADVEGVLGRDDARHGRDGAAAGGVLGRYRGPAVGQHDVADLHRQRGRPAQGHASSASTTRPCCRCRRPPRPIPTTRWWASISRPAWPRW